MRCSGEPAQVPEPRSSRLQLRREKEEVRRWRRSWERETKCSQRDGAKAGALAGRGERRAEEGLEMETPQPTPTSRMWTDVCDLLLPGPSIWEKNSRLLPPFLPNSGPVSSCAAPQ